MHGLNRFEADCVKIVSGGDVLANTLLASDGRKNFLRLFTWRALLRSFLYMHERNLPFTTPTWRIFRGQDEPEKISSSFNRRDCCAVGGLESKIEAALMKTRGPSSEEACKTGLVSGVRDLRMSYHSVNVGDAKEY